MHLSLLDTDRATINPWNLNAHECAVMRVLTTSCSSIPKAARELKTIQKTVNDLVSGVRRKMNRPGNDYRVWAEWATWVAGLGSSSHYNPPSSPSHSVYLRVRNERPLPALLAPLRDRVSNPFRPWTRPRSSSSSSSSSSSRSSFKDLL